MASGGALRQPVEWPTVFLVAATYLIWLVCLMAIAAGGVGWLALPVAIMATTLHASLQHEALHGHPTRFGRLNEALVYLPLGIFIPYRRFKRLHLRHHRNATLTDPYEDPESFYRPRGEWIAYTAPMRAVLNANNTLVGRITLGPAIALFGFWREDLGRLADGERVVIRAWLHHGFGFAGLVSVLTMIGVPVWLYACVVAYPAMSLLMVRTFAEHQAHADPEARTVIIEKAGLFGVLFLNNNLHVVHHENPRAPWYALPRLYAANRDRYRQLNGGYVFPNYRAVFAAYAFSAKEPVPHPTA